MWTFSTSQSRTVGSPLAEIVASTTPRLNNGRRAKMNKEQMMRAKRKLCTHRHWTVCTTKLLVALGLAHATFPRLFYSRIRRPKPLCQSANPAAGKHHSEKLGSLAESPYARLEHTRRGPNTLALVKLPQPYPTRWWRSLGDEISPVPTPRRLGDSLSPLTIQAGVFR